MNVYFDLSLEQKTCLIMYITYMYIYIYISFVVPFSMLSWLAGEQPA